jgi:hypothetical protein
MVLIRSAFWGGGSALKILKNTKMWGATDDQRQGAPEVRVNTPAVHSRLRSAFSVLHVALFLLSCEYAYES